MKIKILLIFFLALILSLPSLTALTLSGKKLSPLIFEPGLIITNHYTISETTENIAVKVSGEMQQYITLTEVVNNEFDMVINFPESLDPGIYHFELSATEIPKKTNEGIGSLLSVSKRFDVEVYSYEKYLEASLSAANVNEGTPVDLKLNVVSKCYQDINSVRGEIIITDAQNNTLKELITEEKPLKALATETLSASFDTTGLPAAEYSAKAIVFYDWEQKTAQTKFRIGQMDLVLKNYTSIVEQGFSDFTLRLANNWGNALQEVYAKLYINKRELLHTPTTEFAPWEEKELKGIINVELGPGIYNATIQLFFEDQIKEVPVIITVVKKISSEELSAELEKSRRNLILLSVAAGILILGLIIVIVRYKKTPKKKQKDEF